MIEQLQRLFMRDEATGTAMALRIGPSVNARGAAASDGADDLNTTDFFDDREGGIELMLLHVANIAIVATFGQALIAIIAMELFAIFAKMRT